MVNRLFQAVLLAVVISIAAVGAPEIWRYATSAASAVFGSRQDIDTAFGVLSRSASAVARYHAAQWLGENLQRPDEDQARKLLQALRDRDVRVRVAVAQAIRKIASQEQYHRGGRTAKELVWLIQGLRECFIYEREDEVRIAILWAVSEFDSGEAQVVLDRGMSENQRVREAATEASRAREQRLKLTAREQELRERAGWTH